MNETSLKNISHQAKPQFNTIKNTVKNTLSDNFYEKSSFDSHISDTKSKNTDKKSEIQNNIKKNPIHNHNKKQDYSKNNTEKQNTSSEKISEKDNNEANNTAEKTDNHTENTETTQTETTQKDKDNNLGAIPQLLINLTGIIAPLPLENQPISVTGLDTVIHDTNNLLSNITENMNNLPLINQELNTNILNSLDNQILAEFNLDADRDEQEIENIEALLDTKNSLSEIISIDTISNSKSFDFLTTKDNPLINLQDNQNLNADSLLQANTTSNIINNLTFNNNSNNIQIQKESHIEIVAQLPLQNDFSLNITKDTNNDNKIGINLEPAGMGDIELVIETNIDNAVTAVIRTDKPEILEQLRKESASLERYLTEAGLNLGGQGLGFEHKQPQDNTQNSKDNNPDNVLNARISETYFNQDTHSTMTTTERLYAHLDKQSIQAGLDIRL